ncbi:hypothetical protein MABM_16660 [Mycobacteroides abscessus]|uniref:YbaB/EbfC family nucleoid-associated protein n=1 Tax=Mycobacteroides abscessus TaxID=36809 RepID=UPI0005A50E78|nr:YbaB/EbfC family nucleoid-associated protein [Mycobacteroides abscessus]BBZ81750.1 hypothetical protein MABM_16660 [Mycobacteroides abscessus]
MDSILQSAWDEQPRRTERDTSAFAAEQGEIFRRVQQQGGEAEDQRGLVKVTVDARGRVETVHLDPRLSAAEMQQLGPHIAAVCAKAFDQRVEQIGKIIAANADYLDQKVVDEITALTRWFRER